jgi:hypothetical protein
MSQSQCVAISLAAIHGRSTGRALQMSAPATLKAQRNLRMYHRLLAAFGERHVGAYREVFPD